MMLQSTNLTDDLVRFWLSHLHRCAFEVYEEARVEERPVQTYVTDVGKDGLVCIIWEKQQIFSYVAFADDVDQAAVQPGVENVLRAAIRGRGPRRLDCTVYGRNHVLIEAIRALGFCERGDGLEFCYMADRPLPEVDLGPLQRRPFAATPIMPYLELLDLAFNRLKLPHDWRTTIFRRDVAGSTRLLMDRNRNGDFAAFWKGERLIGLYYTTANVLETIAVHPDFQNRGYGTRILHHCMHYLLQEKGWPSMYLYVSAANVGARRFYLRNNFVISAEYSQNTFVGS